MSIRKNNLIISGGEANAVHKTGDETIAGVKTFTDGIQASNIVDTSRLTNGIKTIPQDLKVTLSDGLLTLKSGSKLVMPMGISIYDEVTTTSDIVLMTGSSNPNGEMLVFIKDEETALVVEGTKIDSGSTAPGSGYYLWFDTTVNRFKYSESANNSWTLREISYPICSCIVEDGIVTKVKQVFNGFGYFGKSVYGLKNVEGYAYNGLNADGTINNIIWKTNAYQMVTHTASDNGYYYVIVDSDGVLSLSTTFDYTVDTKKTSIILTNVVNGHVYCDDVIHTFMVIDENYVDSKVHEATYFKNIKGEPTDNTKLNTELNNRVLKNNAITGGTYPKITYDSKGLVTGGSALSSSDIPDISSKYVTLDTDQTITAHKLISYNETSTSGNQASLFDIISSNKSSTSLSNWIGRTLIGAKDLTFLMGTYKGMAGIGAHSWTDATQQSGAAWADFYLNPDGDKAVYIGGYNWTADSGWLKVQNNNSSTGGKVYYNKGSSTTPTWKEVTTINDSSTSATNETWSASKLNTEFGNKVTANSAITGATHSKITYDSKGLVTSGSDLALSDFGITATAEELNVLDGITATTTELNYVDGVTSAIQTQLDNKQPKLVSGDTVITRKTDQTSSSAESFSIKVGGIESASYTLQSAITGTTDADCKYGAVKMYGPSVTTGVSTDGTFNVAGMHQFANANYLRTNEDTSSAPSGYNFFKTNTKTLQTVSIATKFNSGKLLVNDIKDSTNTYTYSVPSKTGTIALTSDIPSVIDNVTSTSTTSALSANMGKELQDQIDNLKEIGRFLSLWNCSTGLPTTNPTESPYTYHTGDYFIVSVVASGTGTNYKPNGSTYTTGVASTTAETGTVTVNDYYFYDGTNWKLLSNTQKSVTFANIAGQPSDNTNLKNALDAKVDANTAITGATHSKITYDSKGLVTGGSDLSLSDFGITATASELNTLDGITATTSELNVLDGITATTTELNYVDGVTSNIQTQLNNKQASGNYISYTNNTATVAGTSKTVSKTSPDCLFVGNGLIMGGTALAAGLTTRGICGVATPDATTGACTKENLFLNYDGNETWNPNGRGVVINASTPGTNLGSNMYSYCAVRGDIVKAWVEAKGYVTIDDSSTTSTTVGWSASKLNTELGKKQPSLPTYESGKYLTNNGTELVWSTVDALPSQSGMSGKFLTTNGTTASWATVDALPSQSGQSGKFLTTNGTTASWATVSVEGDTTTINTNSSSKLQAIGIIDKNSGSAKYDWVGTLAQYNALGSYNSNWTYFITDDETDDNVVHTINNESIAGIKTFTQQTYPIKFKSPNIDKTVIPSSTQYQYIDFLDKNESRLGVIGSRMNATTGKYGVYLQAGNIAQLGVLSDGTNGQSYCINPTEDTTTSVQIDTVGARNTKLNTMFQVVDELPESPVAGVFYFIKETS